MNFEPIPVKQTPAQANPPSFAASSPGSRGLDNAAAAFENILNQARTAPAQTQVANERRGNTTNTSGKQTSANKGESAGDSIDGTDKTRDADDEITLDPADASTTESVSKTAASDQTSDEAKPIPGSDSASEFAAIAEAQERAADPMGALAAANANPAAAAGAVLTPNAPTNPLANGIDETFRQSDQAILASSSERKGIRKDAFSRGPDEGPDGVVGEAVEGNTQPVDPNPRAYEAKATTPAKPGKVNDLVVTGNSGFEAGLGEGKNKTGEQDFASILIPAMNGASAIRQNAEPILSGSTTTPLAAQQYEVSYSPESPRFGSSLAGHLTTIISQSVERADIQLNPRELGPIRVEVSVKDRETNVTLIASEPRTIAAIEQSSNMLRTLLTDQGLTLGQFEVRSGFSGSDRSANQQTGQNPDGRPPYGNQISGSDLTGLTGLAELSSLSPTQGPTRRLLDLFA